MSTLVSIYMIFVAILLVLYVVHQVLKGKEDLVSLRNFFIAGLIIFQITGAALSLLTNDVAFFHPADVESSSVIYTLMLTVFIILFLVSYQLSTGFFDKQFSRHTKPQRVYSPMGLMVIAVSIVGFGIVSQYGLVYIPILGSGFYNLAYGMYAIGAGLAAWAAAPRLWNPVFFMTASAIIIFALGLTFVENFGRRELLGVVLAVLWALYFGYWRSLGIQRSFVRMLVVCCAGMVLLGLFTSARTGKFRDQSAMQNIASLKDASASDGIQDVLYGQRAGLNSMWLIESRPDSHPYDTLHSLKLMIGFPIPRSKWIGKPNALGITMPQVELKHSNKPKDWNIGPGIIGHIANDNPYLALWMYPILLGVVIRFLDRAVVWFSSNPFMVLPIGAAIGQFVAMPRGELGSFAFIAVINVVGALVIMRIISWVLTQIGWIKVEQYSWDDEMDEYQEDQDVDWDYVQHNQDIDYQYHD